MESMPEITLDTAKATAKKAATSLKSAGSLVAKKAERTKIVTVTLPRAYAELGKAVYKDSSRREEFAELMNGLDALLAQRKRIHDDAKARPAGNTVVEKAGKVAADAADLAKTKAIDLQAYQAFAKFGEAVYQKHGDNAGPAELVEPISKAVARRNQLDRDTATTNAEAKNGWSTAKGVTLTLVVMLAIGAFRAWLDPDRPNGSGTKSAEKYTRTPAADKRWDEPEKQSAHEQGWQQGVGIANTQLKTIERHAKGLTITKYLAAHPEAVEHLNRERGKLNQAYMASMQAEVKVVEFLHEQGVSEQAGKNHPSWKAAEKAGIISMARLDGFNAVINPLLP